jgi:uncharacterized repeat protein (TIGR03806 family)
VAIERTWAWLGLCAAGLTLGCGGETPHERDAGTQADAARADAEVSDGDGDGDAGDVLAPPETAYLNPPDDLAAWNLFVDPVAQTPGPRTLPYDVIAPLFSDYTAKRRFVYLPENASIGYDATGYWQLPEGSVLIKTFSYPRDARTPELGERLLETRLLVFTGAEVVAHTYVWNEAQTEAKRKIAGTHIASTWIDAEGATRSNDYTVPNTNKCFDCHGKRGETHTLGLTTRQLDRDFAYADGEENQLDHLLRLGWLNRAPEPHAQRERLVDPFGEAALSLRARSYLDTNCSQCHKQGGDASASGMWLDWHSTMPGQDPATWGVCKRPTSAGGATCGHEVDIVPGHPERSIYMCRIESTESEVQMPPVGRNLVHSEGVALLRAWITSLEGACL